MMANVPLIAPGSPPLTGASKKPTPIFAASSAIGSLLVPGSLKAEPIN
jgi:hypothetical protein